METVVLVGHGGVPRDLPRAWITELKRLEGARRARGETEPDAEEAALDAKIRAFPRTPESDPYQAGLLRIADALRPRLSGRELVLAYNEFCAPSLADALSSLAQGGCQRAVVIPSMMTPGGSHSEQEIPETIAAIRKRHPTLDVHYAWPFAPELIASALVAQLEARDALGGQPGAG